LSGTDDKQDYNELQRIQNIKKLLLEEQLIEETNLDHFTFERDRPDLNAVVHLRSMTDQGPFLRLDLVSQLHSRRLFEALSSVESFEKWFGSQCIVNRVIEVSKVGNEVF
jgi:hypothetical protein